MTAKEGDAEFEFLLGAVNQYAYTYYQAALLGYRRHNLAHGVAGGNDIIDDENSLAWADAEASSESPLFGIFLFRKYTANS